MKSGPEQPGIHEEELRGVSRTVAEIEWLLLILVLLYLAFGAPAEENRPEIAAALVAYIVFLLGFHYANFFKTDSRWKVALETWAMLAFITWTVWFTDKLASPLFNAYLLVILTSALTLGKFTTLAEMVLIAACALLLGEHSSVGEMFTLPYIGSVTAQLAPIVLVAYITTMFAADIRYGLEKARLISETDELTGAYNRRGFAILAGPLFAQAQRANRHASILMIDMDDFKAVNDEHGHDAGDRVLRQVARCIETQLRQSDVLARYGGDEFVALLPDTPPNGALEVSRRIRNAVVNDAVEYDGRTMAASLSIGIASYPEDGDAVDTLLQRADRAMYLAKKAENGGIMRFAA